MMKKLSYIAGAAALVMTVACQNEEMPQKNLELFASVEQQSDPSLTKSVLENGATVKWIAGDQIKVYNSTGEGNTVLTANSSAASSTFTGSDLANPTVAIYPSSIATSSDGTNITFTLPATQNYAANSFGQNANVAVGQVSAGTISFKNVCGSLKLQLKGSMKVGKIEITSEKKLNGSFTVNATSSTPEAATDVTSTDSEKKLTLDCGEGVQLDSDTATAFYFIVPTGALASGFTAVIFDKDTEKKDTIRTTKNNNISRSKVKKMPACAVSILPSGYTELKYLEATGTQYVEMNGITYSNYDHITVKFSQTTAAGGYLSKWQAVYGPMSNMSLTINNTDQQFSYIMNSDWCDVSQTYSLNTKYVIEQRGNVFSLDGETLKTLTSNDMYNKNNLAEKSSCNTFMLFERGANGCYFKGKIYYATIKDKTTDNVKYQFIPAKRNSDNVLGMYDLVGGLFYTNKGNGSFQGE